MSTEENIENINKEIGSIPPEPISAYTSKREELIHRRGLLGFIESKLNKII
jgi:hypothetical protein